MHHAKRFAATVVACALAFLSDAASTTPAQANVMTFTSSSAFSTAASGIPLTVENYGTLTAGTLINAGDTVDGLTYTAFTPGPSGALLGGIVTNLFNSISGVSLGGNQSGGDQFFFGGDSFTVTFPTPINAVGAFFNVNLNSGDYVLAASVGTATSGSASYDTSSFVFDGVISTVPFTSVTFSSTDDALGSYNIPEIEYGVAGAATAPEPGTLALLGAGLASFGLIRRKRKQTQS